MNLETLGLVEEFSVDDLVEAHREFLEACPVRRERFLTSRLAIVAASSRRDDPEAMEMRTSGSTGRSKRYRYGPRAVELNNFFFSLVAEGLSWKRWAQLSFRDLGGATSRESEFPQMSGWAPLVSSLAISLSATPADVLDALTGTRPGVIQSYSYNLEKLARSADLSAIDPADVTFASTGDPLSRDVRGAYLKAGHVVRDYMRCWDGGASFYTCRHGGVHWVDMLSATKVDQEGRLISSDLFNLAEPMLEYWNGDVLRRRSLGTCACGAESSDVVFDEEARWFVELGGRHASYRSLRSAVERVSGGVVPGCSFGVDRAGRRILVSYDSDGPVDEVGLANSMSGVIRCEYGETYVVGVRRGLPEGRFKAARIGTLSADDPCEGAAWSFKRFETL